MKKICTMMAAALVLSFGSCRESAENTTTDAGTVQGGADGMESTEEPSSPGTNRSATGTASDASNTPGGGTMTDSISTQEGRATSKTNNR